MSQRMDGVTSVRKAGRRGSYAEKINFGVITVWRGN